MNYKHITINERCCIANFLGLGWSIRKIAKHLNRNASTISREIRRNSVNGKYLAHIANEIYLNNRMNCGAKGKSSNYKLIEYIENGLNKTWSPEQIAGRLRLESKDDKSMKIGFKTIYRWIYKNIIVKGNTLPYVSRGGLKLEKAIQTYPIDLHGAVMIDIGASTGGFTDCALQNGASKVFAIDVGYNQLAWKLRQDSRVINMEKQNIRTVTAEQIGELVDFISIDVAFISLDKVLPVATNLLKDTGSLVALIKPQFEAGKENVGKGGIVRDSEIHKEVLHRILHVAYDCGLYTHGLTFSPIKGMEGNIEFLGYFKKYEEGALTIDDTLIDTVVAEAHSL